MFESLAKNLPRRAALATAAAMLASGLLAGCSTIGPDFVAPKGAQETAFRHADAALAGAAVADTARLPADFDYLALNGLSIEARQKLSAQRPETLAQASRMPGITPAAISLLWVHLKRRSRGDGPPNRHPAARSA